MGFKEIVTKAVVGKGKKSFKNNYSITTENIPTTVLGCWVINHLINFSDKLYQKIQILKNSVKEKVILYIEYLIETAEEKDPNKYLKKGQMKEYFNRKGWILCYCIESDDLIEEKPDLEHPIFHKHNVGRIKVMKDKNKKLDFYKINLIF